ncbi:hypothetical protein CIPAW_06G096300 [Carya illinoinensis]|uniref:Uncharacterized protein n=1 Tax=Carya illinoinensis TaxID=32201 RepID=A0A8T1QAA0_CARIL|nr:hypothetical protein CIPAW_06G096300 [Carya illinoinensis]
METHLDFGSADEHSCSDSGWTIYFGSTTQNENENNSKDKYTRGEDDDESEDSMASDASSGPSHHDELPNGGSRSLDHIKHAKDTANSKLSSAKKPCKQFKKKDERRVKEQNRHSSYRAETAASQVSSGAKVRKTKIIIKEE